MRSRFYIIPIFSLSILVGQPSFNAATIASGSNNYSSVYALDLDQDGDIDFLSASEYGAVRWHKNNGSQNFTSILIANNDGDMSVFAIDMDNDGDIDVLSASRNDDKIAWYENNGSESFTARTISTSADGAHTVFAIDMDKDGDIDVLSASEMDDKIAWYENNGSQSFTARTISTNCLLYTSPSPRDVEESRMPSSA